MNTSIPDISETQFKLTDFPITEFVSDDDGIKRKKLAHKVGNWLAVSYCFNHLWKIYRLDTGKPVISILFDKEEDAVKTAKILSDAFEEYFDLWKEFADADVFSLAKWSVRNGVLIYEVIKSLPPKVNSMDDIKAVETSQSLLNKVSSWYGRLTKRSA